MAKKNAIGVNGLKKMLSKYLKINFNIARN